MDKRQVSHNECGQPINVDIVRAIAALEKSMPLELVAEGVETDDELARVKPSGCEFVQGYRFSRPLLADQLEVWMKETKIPPWLSSLLDRT